MRRLSWGKLRPKRKPTIPLSKQNPRVPVWGSVKNRTRIARPKNKSVRSVSSIIADLPSLFLDGFQLGWKRQIVNFLPMLVSKPRITRFC
jgi:ribosomal protein L39E